MIVSGRSMAGVGLWLVLVSACGDASTTADGANGADPSGASSGAASGGADSGPGSVANQGGGAPDGGSAPGDAGAAGADAGPKGNPFVAPAGTWTYVPMSDVVCGDGSTSGVGINPSSKPNAPVLVFMMGGGACWDAVTCLGGASSNVTNAVGEPEIMADIPRVQPLFDRMALTNPFRDASFVFIPYCTADIHAGDSVQTYSLPTKSITVHHHGAKNTQAVLDRVKATYPSPPRVWLTGASGGGFGAILNYHRFKAAYPQTRVDILNDSGTPVDPTGTLWQDMQASWSLVIPPGCTGCAGDTSKVWTYLGATMGNARMAFLSFTQDQTIRAFTGHLIPQEYETQVKALVSQETKNQKSYLVAGTSHVLLDKDPLPLASSNVPLTTWVTQFATDDPAWADQGP